MNAIKQKVMLIMTSILMIYILILSFHIEFNSLEIKVVGMHVHIEKDKCLAEILQ